MNEIISDLREEKKLLETEQARLLQNALTAGRADPIEMQAMKKKILHLEKELGERLKENADLMLKYQEAHGELLYVPSAFRATIELTFKLFR